MECQELWGTLEGVQETTEISFNATTNLEGGEECRDKVRWELLLDCLVLNFLILANQFFLWFLETLDLLRTSTARMPPEEPCCHVDKCLGQDVEQHGVFGKDKEDELLEQEWNDVE